MKLTNARLGFISFFIAANEKPDFFKKVGFLTPLATLWCVTLRGNTPYN
jgi:hypothetical protein